MTAPADSLRLTGIHHYTEVDISEDVTIPLTENLEVGSIIIRLPMQSLAGGPDTVQVEIATDAPVNESEFFGVTKREAYTARLMMSAVLRKALLQVEETL